MNLSNISLLILSFLVLGLIIWASRKSAILKDQLIPQISPDCQTYSLARTQMAFWFLIILWSFLYLLIAKGGDWTGIITSQALALMGISGLTAGGAAVVEKKRDTPEDALNDGLKALGLSSYQDIVALRQTIADLKEKARAGLTASEQATLNDKNLLLQTYTNRISPFISQGWFKDLVTDIDGTALHRLQAFVWTVVLGGIFVYSVYTNSKHVMPEFDTNLLELMGISNAGYVGFKANESQY